MADGFADSNADMVRKPYAWQEIFRCFQVALDPRKLLIAAAGILATWLGWYVLSSVFYRKAPDPKAAEYTVAVVQKDFENKKKSDGSSYSTEEIEREAKKRFDRDWNQWAVLNNLAGENGRISSPPWRENRGENPYVFLTNLSKLPAADWVDRTWAYLKQQMPVMAEPLAKLMLPIVKIADPDCSPMTRFYLVLCLFWSIAVWAFCGGVITRIAAVQLSGKDRVGIMEAVKFVCNRYLSYILAPLVPMGVIGIVVVGLCLLAFICLIPFVGDVLYAALMPLVILGGIMMAILLIGLLGYPLMYTTLSTEGSDTFDALSRSYNYVFQSPWTYAWYWIVAILYGAIVTFFVVFVASLMVYLGKWAIVQTPLAEATNQKADYLFIYTPESFGWKELLLRGTDLQVNRDGSYSNPAAAEAYRKSYTWYNWIGAGVTTFWLTLVFLLMLGFSYSFFWSAATMIYFLMRRHVDEVDLDEVYLEDEELPPPPSAPIPNPTSPPAASTSATSTTLPIVAPDEGSGTKLEVPKLPPDSPSSNTNPN